MEDLSVIEVFFTILLLVSISFAIFAWCWSSQVDKWCNDVSNWWLINIPNDSLSSITEISTIFSYLRGIVTYQCVTENFGVTFEIIVSKKEISRTGYYNCSPRNKFWMSINYNHCLQQKYATSDAQEILRKLRLRIYKILCDYSGADIMSCDVEYNEYTYCTYILLRTWPPANLQRMELNIRQLLNENIPELKRIYLTTYGYDVSGKEVRHVIIQ